VLSLSVAAPAYADPAFGPGNNGLLLDDLTGVLRDLELVRVVFGIPGERAASMDLPVAEAGGSVYIQADGFTNPGKCRRNVSLRGRTACGPRRGSDMSCERVNCTLV
jgi:hypothetical protein